MANNNVRIVFEEGKIAKIDFTEEITTSTNNVNIDWKQYYKDTIEINKVKLELLGLGEKVSDIEGKTYGELCGMLVSWAK